MNMTRVNLDLNVADKKLLDNLGEKLDATQAQVLRKALRLLHAVVNAKEKVIVDGREVIVL